MLLFDDFKLFLLFLLLTAAGLWLPLEAQADFLPNLNRIQLAPIAVKAGSTADVVLRIDRRRSAKLNPAAPALFKVQVISAHGSNIEQIAVSSDSTVLGISLPTDGAGVELKASAVLYYCKNDDTSICFIKSFLFEQQLQLVADPTAGRQIVLTAVLE